MEDRNPAIFYHSIGFLEIANNYYYAYNYNINFNIDFKKWYHIEIAQTKKNGKVIKRLIIL